MSHYPWIEYFNLSEAEINRKYSGSADQNQSLLGYAIRNQLISEENYFSWAKNHYKIPVLKSEYFNQHKIIDKNAWERWKTQYTWSKDCFPLIEWDGNLIIGCLEVPMGIVLPAQSIWVLASPTQLEVVWKKFQNVSSSVSSPSQEVSIEDLLSGLPEEKSNLIDKTTPSGSIIIDDLETESKKSELPEGLDLDGFSPKTSSGLTPSENSENVSLDNLDELFQFEKNQPIPQPSSSVSSSPTLKPSVAPVSSSTKPSTTPKMSTASKISEVAPPPPAAAVFSTPKPQQPAPHKNDNFPMELWKKGNPQKAKKIADEVFSKMKNFFHKTVIFSMDSTETKARALFWDSEFNDIKNETALIDLTIPSIFRIASQSQKPYHGYVVSNAINDQFFQDWNAGNTPEHITIVPVSHEGKVVALIVGFADQLATNKQSLQHAEKIAEELKLTIYPNKKQMAA